MKSLIQKKMSEHKVSVVLKSIMLNYSISNIYTGNHLTIKCQKTTTTKKKKKKKTFSEIIFSFQVGAAPLIPSIRVVMSMMVSFCAVLFPTRCLG